jgi:histidinol dehydrogenase
LRIISSQSFKEKILEQVINRYKRDLSSTSLTVQKIISDVKRNGDDALLHYTKKFDKVNLSLSNLKVTDEEITESFEQLEKDQISALKKAAINISFFHKKQKKATWSVEIIKGITTGQIIRPLSTIGVYAPGGKTSYPTSVLMCVIPAIIAGVKKIIICSPPNKNGKLNPAILAAAKISGVTEVFKVGGAQAIAAMAYGTQTIPKVDKIFGPGNIFVTAAKLKVNKDVAIDFPAGPSEILIIADRTAKASFIASDLLAQAEHDSESWAILITTSKNLAQTVAKEIQKQIKFLSRKEIISSSLQKNGLIIIVDHIEEAVNYSNLIAPEHVHIQTKNAQKVVNMIQNAGAIFLGEYSPIAFGDYSAGINHVLPTGGYAKVYSGLSIKDFVKTINFLKCEQQGYQTLKKTTITLAKMEQFDGHAKSVSIREEK